MVPYGVKNEINMHKSIPITKDFENALSSFYLEVIFKSCSTEKGEEHHNQILEIYRKC